MSKIPLFLGGVMIGLIILYTIKSPAILPVEDGDLIFHYSKSGQSPFLKQLTGSVYTHMGIIFFEAGKPYVYEASNVVKFRSLEDWINRGVNEHFVIKRLKKAKKELTEDKLQKMRKKGLTYKAKKYDVRFLLDDEFMYCSELVWKIYKEIGIEIGTFKKFNEFDLDSPKVAEEIKSRYTNHGFTFDSKENVITPVDMFNSSKLMEVQRGGEVPK